MKYKLLETVEKTAFVTPKGHYEFMRCHLAYESRWNLRCDKKTVSLLNKQIFWLGSCIFSKKNEKLYLQQTITVYQFICENLMYK